MENCKTKHNSKNWEILQITHASIWMLEETLKFAAKIYINNSIKALKAVYDIL